MATIWYESKIKKIEETAPGVRLFHLENPGITYNAGQFITFDLPIGDKRLQRWRSYSIANASKPDEDLELCIVRSTEGDGTKFLFEETKVGSTLRWKGPDGGFVLPERLDERDLVMICTGTGIAPFRCMLQEIATQQTPHRKLHLIFGTRTENDILYRSELTQLQQELPGFEFDIALSRQEDWEGYKGYVHQIYQEKYKVPRPDILFMICGWTQMIDEAVANLLTEMQYSPLQVKYELYG